ncbi:antitoxin [Streptomyces sp. ISL-1]|uniref:antitoxin n=1 Tax=Streptomyces sp. ISL-1 TaxID=2817657 RepID=UPI001BECE6B7|nr:antitoxin [Streptomyces sp. ISL-1]MBT2393639.1 antitoxin [Streptomyces sp. ISL-1]
MSMMDKLKSMLKGHEGQADKGVDKTGDYADEKTRGKHRGQVDTGQDKLKEQYGSDRRDEPPRT